MNTNIRKHFPNELPEGFQSIFHSLYNELEFTNWGNILNHHNISLFDKNMMSYIAKRLSNEVLVKAYVMACENVCNSTSKNLMNFKISRKAGCTIINKTILFNEIMLRENHEFFPIFDPSSNSVFERPGNYVSSNIKDFPKFFTPENLKRTNDLIDCFFYGEVILRPSFFNDHVMDYFSPYGYKYYGLTKTELLEKVKSVKRSEGYMEKRYEYVKVMIEYGRLDTECVDIINKNLSKKFKKDVVESSQSKMKYLKDILTKNHGDDYYSTSFYHTKQELKVLLLHYSRIVFENLDVLDYWNVDHLNKILTKEDVPLIMPLLSTNKKIKSYNKERIMNRIKSLLSS